MISFTLSRTVWWWVLQTRRGRRGPTLWNFIKVFPLIITPLFSHNNLFYFLVIKDESKENIIPEEMVPVDVRSV